MSSDVRDKSNQIWQSMEQGYRKASLKCGRRLHLLCTRGFGAIETRVSWPPSLLCLRLHCSRGFGAIQTRVSWSTSLLRLHLRCTRGFGDIKTRVSSSPSSLLSSPGRGRSLVFATARIYFLFFLRPCHKTLSKTLWFTMSPSHCHN